MARDGDLERVSLAQHLKCCLLFEGNVTGAAEAMERMLSIHHPAKILAEVAPEEGIAWLLRIPFRATRHLLRAVGDHVAIISNSKGDSANGEVPLSTSPAAADGRLGWIGLSRD